MHKAHIVQPSRSHGANYAKCFRLQRFRLPTFRGAQGFRGLRPGGFWGPGPQIQLWQELSGI